MAFRSVKVQPQLLTGVLARPEELPRVQEFRIASYNAWNLFGEAPDVHSARPSDPASDEQLDALAKMILNLHADAIAFQEVQNEKVLGALFRERVNPKIKDAPYRFATFVCLPARDPRGINVALATRLAVRGSVTFHDREFGPTDDDAVRFSRDLLGVELFATPEYRFLMFVAHLKSKIGGDEATGKRRLEASEIRTILEDPQMGGNPYLDQDLVLCGDMNDDPDGEVVRILTEGTGPSAKPLRDVLGSLRSYPTHKRYKKTRLDYILASPTIAIQEPEVHTEEPAAEASDHYPVSATVRVK
jgi:endonuclease/exonuclease/phosphatase family metal-dependent hydrolase